MSINYGYILKKEKEKAKEIVAAHTHDGIMLMDGHVANKIFVSSAAGDVALSSHTKDVLSNIGTNTTSIDDIKSKTNYIDVTGAVNLDDLSGNITALQKRGAGWDEGLRDIYLPMAIQNVKFVDIIEGTLLLPGLSSKTKGLSYNESGNAGTITIEAGDYNACRCVPVGSNGSINITAGYDDFNTSGNIVLKQNNSEKMKIDNNGTTFTGDVGIGITPSNATLEINGTGELLQNVAPANSECLIYGYGTGAASEILSVLHTNQTQAIQIGYDTIKKYQNFTGGANGLRFNASGSTDMIILDNGDVGIGTTTPESLLTIGNHAYTNGTRDLIRFPSYRHGEAFTIRNNDAVAYGKLEFFWGNSTNGSGGHDNTVDWSILTLQHDGRVGIGTSAPAAGLHVTTAISGAIGTAGFLAWNGTTSTFAYGTRNIAIKTENGHIWSSGAFSVLVNSDKRIKTDIVSVPDNLSLGILRKLDCVYYSYIDKTTLGNGKTIGWLAQDVKEHFPIAVSIQQEDIPNEMRKLENLEWEEIVVGTQKQYKLINHGLEECQYRFYVKKDASSNEIRVSLDYPFLFKEKYEEIFCYGKRVDDFLTIDKAKIQALSYSALQEIDKIQQQHKIEIKTLEDKLRDIEERLSAGGL